MLEKIKKLCHERGLTISALERELGMGNATIRGWETSSPTVENAKKVADFFGCTVDDLLKTNTITDQKED